ncbi:MAG: GTP-binding protein [Gaiellaceae bacterium]
MSHLNLGILAHVDAGKTTLTERLLFLAGVIDAPGSVDHGTTQTDSLELERARGITIKSAVVAFSIGDVKVNLIDTPGHPDFIAEVERVIGVLDGAVLVISAVEGVQPQTPLLMRALQRLRIPTVLFVNKMDRMGADGARTLGGIRERLSVAAVAAGDARALAEQLAENDEELLARLVDGAHVAPERVRTALREQTRGCLVHPVFFGSAITGAGVPELQTALAELLPVDDADPEGQPGGRVFKIERSAGGEKVAYVRMFSGTLRTRDRVRVDGGAEVKVTAIDVFDAGAGQRRQIVSAGEIAKMHGLGGVRIGDAVGETRAGAAVREFAPPTLEAAVEPVDADDRARLRVALVQLAEQDPLIDIRQNERSGELSVSLYGDVQKEVIEATLASDYAIAVRFRETTPIYVERPRRAGEWTEELHADSNPFSACVGLRIEPAPAGSGTAFILAVGTSTIPLYAYKSVENFTACMQSYVAETFEEGMYSWPVVDCVVTMIACAYASADGPPSRRGPMSMPNDYRRLTPIVLMHALERAGTIVCEPMLRARIDVPAESLGASIACVGRLGGVAEPPVVEGRTATLLAVVAAARSQELQRQLASATHGEGVMETSFGGYEPVDGEPPRRERTTPNPLNLQEYMLALARKTRT